MRVEPGQLKAFLIDAGVIDEKKYQEIEEKAKKTGQNLEDLLVSSGITTYEELIKLKAYILGIPFISLEGIKVEPNVLAIIPEPIARTHNIVAFRKKGKELEVAMLDPEDLKTIEFIKKTTGLKILPRLTTPEGIKSVLRQYEKTLEAEFSEIIKKEAGIITTIKEEEKLTNGKELKSLAEELPVIRIVETLLKHAVLERASDIHIEPTEKEVIVRYRIDGILRDAMILPKKTAPGIVARIKVLSNLKLDEHRLPQDGRFKVEGEDYRYSIRVSILPVIDGEKVVMRLLPESSKALSLEELGLFGETLEKVQTILRKPMGMILVCGPTGSGKTTTLYSMMEILNKPGVNISTIEDPVEYRMPRVNQTQVKPEIGLTFASGLRALLRQDPDIIMVGEIRDNETANLAINAALTGHLVLSTIHTTTAAGAIPRLLDMKIEPFLISSTLIMIISQRLIRKLAGEREKYFLKEEEIKEIKKYCDLEAIREVLIKEKIIQPNQKIEEIPFYKPIPTKEYSTGYKGRIGIYEVLLISETIKELIIKRVSSDEIQEQAKKEGMILMVEDGFIKAAKGITSIEEVLRVIME